MIAHLTVLDLDRLASRRGAFEAVLSPDERVRALRLRTRRDRARLITRRGALRHLLASCLGRDPAWLRFTEGPHGKPALLEAPGLQFSTSSSGHLAAIAVAENHPVGVDIEVVRPLPDWRAVASLFLPLADCARLERLPPAHCASAFLRLWTVREAAAKCTGAGLRERPSAADAATVVRTLRVAHRAWVSVAGAESSTPEVRRPTRFLGAATIERGSGVRPSCVTCHHM